GLGFAKEDRDTNIERIGWVASRLTRQGAAVIAAAISPYEETRRKARAMVEEWGAFVEVFVGASVEECARRDVKGLYEKAFRGEIKGFTAGGRPQGMESLEQIALSSRELSDLDMLASGALSPLEGFMGREDYERVVEEMRLAGGLPWALPVCLAVDAAPSGDRVALTDEAGRALAVLDVEGVFEYDKEREAEQCFRTTESAHPGVARLYEQRPRYLAARVTGLDRLQPPSPQLAFDPADQRRPHTACG